MRFKRLRVHVDRCVNEAIGKRKAAGHTSSETDSRAAAPKCQENHHVLDTGKGSVIMINIRSLEMFQAEPKLEMLVYGEVSK